MPQKTEAFCEQYAWGANADSAGFLIVSNQVETGGWETTGPLWRYYIQDLYDQNLYTISMLLC